MNNKREFYKLLVSSFVSQSGSHFLTLALSAFILVSSGSPIQAALVFVVSYFPSILVSSRLGHWVDTRLSRFLLARNELISIFSTVLCGVIIANKLPLVFLCIVLAMRSLLIFVTRAAAAKWIKLITPPELQTGRIKLFYLSFFLSTALAGVLLGFTISKYSIWKIVAIDSFSYVVSAILILTLVKLPKSQYVDGNTGAVLHPHIFETLSTIFKMPLVRNSFLVVCFSQSLFQGAYSVLVSYLPIQHFKTGFNGVGSFQIAASIGITGGFLINWFWEKLFEEKRPEFPMKGLLIFSAAIICLISTTNTEIISLSLGSFLLLNFFYECVWLHNSSEFFRASPKASAARYQFTLSACAAFFMSLSTLAYSMAIEYWGLNRGVLFVLAFSMIVVVMISVAARRSGEVTADGGHY